MVSSVQILAMAWRESTAVSTAGFISFVCGVLVSSGAVTSR